MKNDIRILRAKKNISQEALSKIIGISRPALSHIETNKVNPSSCSMIKIAKYFGIPVEQIFFEDDVLLEEQK